MRADRLAEGKVPWETIATAVSGALPPEVLLGPARGEDAALVRVGGEVWVVATDPITFTARDAGRLAVVVNANDVAVRGARPSFFTAVVLLAPAEAEEPRVQGLLTQIRDACESLGVALIGGHTEVSPGLAQSVVVGTMIGKVEGRPITTGGLQPGDRVGITKWAGLEGTAILLTEFGDRLRQLHGPEAFRPLEAIFPGEHLSVVPEALLAASLPAVHALHDVTEGGVGEGLFELGAASGRAIEVSGTALPVLPETKLLCGDLRMDPRGLIGSGALLVGCGPEGTEELTSLYRAAGIPFRWIGTAVEGPAGSDIPRFPRDEMLKAGLLRGIEAFVFDLDGTLVDAEYDWPTIRKRFAVTEGTIIDHLNGLEEPERERRWRELEQIEDEATRRAKPLAGAGPVLELLRGRNIPIGLVTNNSAANARALMERFGLSFDLVLTRDDGLWKPSGAPLREAARRLGRAPATCLAVGDSHYDVAAAAEAGFGRMFLVHAPETAREKGVDLSFPDLESLHRYLQVVL